MDVVQPLEIGARYIFLTGDYYWDKGETFTVLPPSYHNPRWSPYDLVFDSYHKERHGLDGITEKGHGLFWMYDWSYPVKKVEDGPAFTEKELEQWM